MRSLILLFYLLFCLGPIAAQKNGDAFKLVWADEFTKEGRPDEKNWKYEKGFVRNHEAQFYQPENAFCAKGLLVIEARKEHKANPMFVADSKDWRKSRSDIEFTSACLISRGLQQWQYGRFEIRARIPVQFGYWPAWWTLGIEKNWPANGEIDIMEFYRGRLLANIACLGKDKKPEWFSNKFSVDSLGGKQWADQFHIWRMDWDESFITLWLDNQVLNKVSVDLLQNKDGSGFQPFKQPHFMLLNLAIGGDNGGDPAGSDFPGRMEVDYVRVYQKK